MIYLKLLIMAVVVVFVVDLSGFVQSVKDWLSRWLDRKVTRLRPLDCSLCMTWWTGLIYAWILGAFSIQAVAYVALLAWLSGVIRGILILIADALTAALRYLSNKLNY